MKTLKLLWPSVIGQKIAMHLFFICAATMMVWHALPFLLQFNNPTVGLVDGGLWQLLLFSLISFLMLLGISFLLFKWLLAQLAFPPIHLMILQFNNLTLWQQYVGYWASFALLFAGALLSLAAVF